VARANRRIDHRRSPKVERAPQAGRAFCRGRAGGTRKDAGSVRLVGQLKKGVVPRSHMKPTPVDIIIGIAKALRFEAPNVTIQPQSGLCGRNFQSLMMQSPKTP
jgi:hypothetical protein